MPNVYIVSVGFTFLYSISIIIQQHIVRNSISPIVLNLVTSLTAATIVGLYLVFFKRSILHIDKSTLKYGLTIGILNTYLADLLVVFGFIYSESINWSVLQELTIPIMAILVAIFLKRHITKRQIISLIVSMLGAYIIIGNIFQLSVSVGDILFLLAVVCFGLGNMISEKATVKSSILLLVFIRLVTASILLGLTVLLFIPSVVWPVFWIPLALGSFMVIGNLSVMYIIKKAGAAFFTISNNLIPIFTTILTIIIWQTIPPMRFFIGAGLVSISLYIFSRKH